MMMVIMAIMMMVIMIIMVMVLMTIVISPPPIATTFIFRKTRDLEKPSHDHKYGITINQNKFAEMVVLLG